MTKQAKDLIAIHLHIDSVDCTKAILVLLAQVAYFQKLLSNFFAVNLWV